ncbi:discoidin domain-containing protein [Pedobacter sp. SYP-B3415]|uniref:discoidin domain-containing protein n=1 Tax=Pedobacter sp. SYP-B3415 TaxID=2496641 RepID=UPI00101D83FB|nr:discoidin domain-containing protein [Pedobacter sp. SYP-B3415]
MFNSYKSLYGCGLLALLLLTACEKNERYTEETGSRANALVFAARANKGVHNLAIFPYADTARTFRFAAAVGMVGLPAEPIQVTFAEDVRAFDSLNRQRLAAGQEPYERFPADAFSFDRLTVTIPRGGQTSDMVTLSYFAKKFDSDKDYLMPVSITSAAGYAINPTVRTVIIIAPRLSERLASKTGWLATANSEELEGEGATNGRAAAAIDGDVNTFWHSVYTSEGEPPYPHWISIDMKETIYVTRIDLAPRQDNPDGFGRFDMEGSTDGTTWITLAENLRFDPTNKAFQKFQIPPAFYRHIRIRMLEPFNEESRSTHLGEINVYRY